MPGQPHLHTPPAWSERCGTQIVHTPVPSLHRRVKLPLVLSSEHLETSIPLEPMPPMGPPGCVDLAAPPEFKISLAFSPINSFSMTFSSLMELSQAEIILEEMLLILYGWLRGVLVTWCYMHDTLQTTIYMTRHSMQTPKCTGKNDKVGARWQRSTRPHQAAPIYTSEDHVCDSSCTYIVNHIPTISNL